MTTTPDDLIQAVRAWLKVGAVDPGAPALTDVQVIKARQDGPRPVKPYLTVNVLLFATPQGEDDEVPGIAGGGEPTRKTRGDRGNQVSVQAHGLGAVTWLETAVARLRHDAIKVLHSSLGISVTPDGGLVNLSTLIDSGFEDRYAREFGVLYSDESAEETMNEATTVITTATQQSTHGDLIEVIIEPEP